MAAMGALFGAAVGASLHPPLIASVLGAFSGFIDFATMGLLIGGAESFLPRTRVGSQLDRAPFLAVFGVKALVYSTVILCVVVGRLGATLVAPLAGSEIANSMRQQLDTKLPLGVLIPTAFMAAFFFLVLRQLRLLVGDTALRDIVLGRYHRARMEDRFFLFVDIVGSTPLAEKIGPVAANRFLSRVFQIASDPVDDHAGEIYQYVGDEMVITWKVTKGRVLARPLACYFAIEQALGNAADEFTAEFGSVPRLRAALHAGPVITGEVGGSRRAIVFHGDVMNTTSRIENATRDLRRAFLVSEDALNRIEGRQAYDVTDLGPHQLRGRESLVRLYAVERVAKTPKSAVLP
jgi:adenylate cyclase